MWLERKEDVSTAPYDIEAETAASWFNGLPTLPFRRTYLQYEHYGR